MNRQARPAPPSPNLVIIKGEEGERRERGGRERRKEKGETEESVKEGGRSMMRIQGEWGCSLP